MKCTNCGYEPEGNALYCAKCGAALPTEPAPEPQPAPAAEPQTVVPPNVPIADPKSNSLLAALKDALFLLICICVTASAGFSLLSGGLPVIQILFAIFLWITLAKASKNILSVEHLQCISGTVYANYVVCNVCAILLLVSGVITTVSFLALSATPEFAKNFSFANELIELVPELEPLLANLNYSIFGIILGIVFVFVGVIILLISLLGLRKIHRFAKSVYQGVGNPFFPFEDPRSAKTWLLVFGIVSGISALSALGTGLFAFLSAAAAAAAPILAVLLIDKYILK